jgi:hypothetical protein
MSFPLALFCGYFVDAYQGHSTNKLLGWAFSLAFRDKAIFASEYALTVSGIIS